MAVPSFLFGTAEAICFRYKGGYVSPASTICTFDIFRTRSNNISIPDAAAPISRSPSSEPKFELIPLWASQTVTTVPSGTRACVRWRRWHPAPESSDSVPVDRA